MDCRELKLGRGVPDIFKLCINQRSYQRSYRVATQLRAGGKVERQEWGGPRSFPGGIVREDEQRALLLLKGGRNKGRSGQMGPDWRTQSWGGGNVVERGAHTTALDGTRHRDHTPPATQGGRLVTTWATTMRSSTRRCLPSIGTNQPGPRQAFAGAIVEVAERMTARNCRVTLPVPLGPRRDRNLSGR